MNIAIQKTAWYWPDGTNSHALTERLTDGSVETDSPSTQCAQTDSATDPWILIDLDRTYSVTAVKLLNRGDCCGNLT